MSLSEFSLIENYFHAIGRDTVPVTLGIGDDAAILQVPAGDELIMTMDTLIAGRHFPESTLPEDIGWKSLAVNLSDLAAMGAKPAWFLLSLTMPEADENWLAAFSKGLSDCAQASGIRLVGGDTCSGPMSISIQATGLLPAGEAVRRDGAQVGDKILVSGSLGLAALGLAAIQGRLPLSDTLNQRAVQALNRPRPRLELANWLREHANSAIDLSDGLAGDLRHILKRSGVGARIDQDALPVIDWIKRQGKYRYAISGGDDYEICCTIDPGNLSAVDEWNDSHPGCPLSCIGEITSGGYEMRADGQWVDLDNQQGFLHFGD